MRFKQFIAEEQSLLKGFRQHLKTMADRDYALWRGIPYGLGKKLGTIDVDVEGVAYKLSVLKFDGRNAPRNSQSGDNSLMHIVSEWKGFPRRNMSVFCTQGWRYADKFGAPAIVIPADDVTSFGYLPHDFNYPSHGSPEYKVTQQFVAIIKSLKLFMSCVHELVAEGQRSAASEMRDAILSIAKEANAKIVLTRDMDVLVDVYKNSSKEHMDEMYRFADVMIENLKRLKQMNDAYHVVRKLDLLVEEINNAGYKSIKDFIDDVTPDRFGAKVFNFKSLPNEEGKHNEIWFEGDFIALIFEYDEFEYMTYERICKVIKAVSGF